MEYSRGGQEGHLKNPAKVNKKLSLRRSGAMLHGYAILVWLSGYGGTGIWEFLKSPRRLGIWMRSNDVYCEISVRQAKVLPLLKLLVTISSAFFFTIQVRNTRTTQCTSYSARFNGRKRFSTSGYWYLERTVPNTKNCGPSTVSHK
uniref:Uncharacterized protein n=1 Tax=Oryza brachyantha TaxID=4533 RepID=J3LFI7_ORYBR